MTDWRSSVKVWKVESFFGKWVVVPDDSDAYCYIAGWRWLAVQEANRLATQYGGAVQVVDGDGAGNANAS
jgi:hypothetical protein